MHAANGMEGPLILLTDPLSFRDNQALAEWLDSHEIVTYRASDAMDAVGYISDFTLSSFPDLITIPRGDKEDAASVINLMRSLAGKRFDLSVYYYSEESGRRRCISLEEIDDWLIHRGGQSGTS